LVNRSDQIYPGWGCEDLLFDPGTDKSECVIESLNVFAIFWIHSVLGKTHSLYCSHNKIPLRRGDDTVTGESKFHPKLIAKFRKSM
jgi:hypothetical protein